MGQGRWAKVTAETAAEVCGRYGPSEDARALLRAGDTPQAFVERLVQAGQYLDVYDFLAHGLPKREAIWWACLGLRHAQGPDLPPRESAALKAAIAWLVEPDDSKRRAAMAAAQAADFGTPAGCAALAVFGSGGSLSPPNLPEVPVEPYMTAQAVAGSLALASVKPPFEAVLDVQRELAALGIALAEGKVVCPAAKPPTTESAPQKHS
jgi:hypothetical protein